MYRRFNRLLRCWGGPLEVASKCFHRCSMYGQILPTHTPLAFQQYLISNLMHPITSRTSRRLINASGHPNNIQSARSQSNKGIIPPDNYEYFPNCIPSKSGPLCHRLQSSSFGNAKKSGSVSPSDTPGRPVIEGMVGKSLAPKPPLLSQS